MVRQTDDACVGCYAMRLGHIVFRCCGSEKGATAVEYGLIAALIATVLIAALMTIGTELNETFSVVGNILSAAQSN